MVYDWTVNLNMSIIRVADGTEGVSVVTAIFRSKRNFASRAMERAGHLTRFFVVPLLLVDDRKGRLSGEREVSSHTCITGTGKL